MKTPSTESPRKALTGEYAIDVIRGDFLGEYLNVIDAEVRGFINRIRRHRWSIVESVVAEALKERQSVAGRLRRRLSRLTT